MRYLLLIMSLMFTVGLLAQRGEERGKRGDKIEQQRIAYITTELDLSVEESQTFWPLYNDYQDAKKENGPDRRSEKNIDDLTEQEASAMLIKSMEAKKKQVDLEYEFMNKLERVLSAKNRLKLTRVEREFKKEVLKRYKKRMKRGEKMEEKKSKKDKYKQEQKGD